MGPRLLILATLLGTMMAGCVDTQPRLQISINWYCTHLDCELEAAHRPVGASYEWTVGGERGADSERINVTFEAPGTYPVKLEVREGLRTWHGSGQTLISTSSPNITETAFADGATIPAMYGCYSAPERDMSPPFLLQGLGNLSQAVAMIMDDPDAGGFTHWILWDAHFEIGALRVVQGKAPDGAIEGANDFGENGYGGPCPPPHTAPHTYRFRFFLLHEPLGLAAGTDRATVETAAAADSIFTLEWSGSYGLV